MTRNRKIKQARQPFHLLCKPIGAQCNLRCSHCFYLEKKDLYPGETHWPMDEKVLERFVKAYIHSHPPYVQEIQFAWQGGEPTLMGLDFFRRALELQKKHARKGLRIANALQTNGTLLDDEWGRFLAENAFLVGISVDGPEQIHNRFRPYPDGRGSFARVMEGVETLKRNNVEFNTLTCLQSDNAEHPVVVYEFLKSIGSRFFQFIPIVEPMPDGTLSDRTVSGKQFGNFMNGVFDEWLKADIGEIFVQHFDVMLGMVMGQPSSICVHSPVCGRALVVEHNGDVYACDHFVTETHRLGNVMNDSLTWMVDGEEQATFGRNKSASLPRHCQTCRYLRFCYGGCPSDRHLTTPDGEPGLNVCCEGYAAFYAHTLPIFTAMAEALRQRRPAREWMQMAGQQRPG